MSISTAPTHGPKQRTQDRRSRTVEPGGADATASLRSPVTFRLRRLEPMVAWAVAGYTFWVSIFLSSDGASAWSMAFFAACIGAWGRAYPARIQAMLLGRGLLLLAGGQVLLLASDAGGAVGAYFFWPTLVAIFYGLLLITPGAVLLTVLAVAGFGLSWWLYPTITPWRQALACGAFLILAPLLATVFGRSMRQSEERAESSLRDLRTLLYNETGFFVHGAVLLAECRQKRRPFTMVLLNAADLRDIPELLGHKVASDLMTKLVQAVGAIPGEGIAARIDSVEFAMLLPGVTSDQAVRLLKQRLGEPATVDLNVEARNVAIGLDMGIEQITDPAQNLEDVYDKLHARWSKPVALQSVRTQGPLLDPDDDRPDTQRRSGSPTLPMSLTGL